MNSKYIWLAAVAVGMASCQNDLTVAEQSAAAATDGIITLSASVGNSAQSRAMIELGNTDISGEHFLWNEGDSLSIFDFGSDGTDCPETGLTLTISADYSDDTPSNSATFEGVGSIDEGNTVFALYPAQDTYSGDGTFTLTIDDSAALGSNSDEEIKAYMTDNIFMYATSTFSSSGTGLSFNYLVSMARIVYTNASSTEQTISNVSISGDDCYFGGMRTLMYTGPTMYNGTNVPDISGEYTNLLYQTFDGLTVGVGDTAEFYLLFFPGSDFNSDGTISIGVNELSVEMETADITTDNFTAGLRYKFNVSQTDDELVWTNAADTTTGSDVTGDDYQNGGEY